MSEKFLWVEKYKPDTIEDCILPDNIKETFQRFIERGEIPNMLLNGPPGIGKTTVAKTLCEQLGVDHYYINGSDEGRFLDTVRNKARNFASTVSLTSEANHKVIIIDEADNTTPDVQLLLRASIEEFYNNCRFIFTSNYKNKIIDPLHSRCSVIEFAIKSKEKPKIALEFYERLKEILSIEKVEYDSKVLLRIVDSYFPDWRRLLNECQRYSVCGRIDMAVLATFSDIDDTSLIKFMKEKNYPEVRLWVNSHLSNDPYVLLRKLFDSFHHKMVPTSIPQMVLIIAKYSHQHTMVADSEVNILAALVEIMVECEFK
tara:strand:- start:50 stop:994 length:945 start_codon:yes stop_codon:yes gene_type:complete